MTRRHRADSAKSRTSGCCMIGEIAAIATREPHTHDRSKKPRPEPLPRDCTANTRVISLTSAPPRTVQTRGETICHSLDCRKHGDLPACITASPKKSTTIIREERCCRHPNLTARCASAIRASVPPLAVVIGAQQNKHVFHGHHDDQRPQDQRQEPRARLAGVTVPADHWPRTTASRSA